MRFRRVLRVLARALVFVFILSLAVLPVPLPPFLVRRLRPKRAEVTEVVRDRRP